ncbi:hypothetical protein HYH02_009326 [Chlamydomonas schloesseri]|uniref:Uncharacterized protein n=1 Tax=Chlamydomonas schloesseri TaxID=2026947 RepID=A0A835TGS7_9CHLO|nr:hypothetical protein HYH02_009326 [Chlamydomonas schloesseri]|eukprot:KAG2443253.1 hypothetical protein HYH02_009326 [Chlamydomonas schloesseri]
MAPSNKNTPATAQPLVVKRQESRKQWHGVGYSCLAFSLGCFGLSQFFLPTILDPATPTDKQRLFSSLAVAWCVFVFSLIRGFIWQSDKEAAPSNGQGGASGKQAVAEDAEDSNTAGGATRRTRRA